MEMYVHGVSTRKVARVTEALCGTNFSKSQVSTLSGRLDTELEAWRNRPLTGSYPYLTVDARYEDVRENGRVAGQGVLIGIRGDGKREILAVTVADTESEATYNELFRDLKARGLEGVLLATSDNHSGIKASVKRHFQGASWQRCQFHFTRNATGLVSRKKRSQDRRWFKGGDQQGEHERGCACCKTPILGNAPIILTLSGQEDDCYHNAGYP